MTEEIINGVLGYRESNGKWQAYDSALLTDRIILLENHIGEMESALTLLLEQYGNVREREGYPEGDSRSMRIARSILTIST
jgi:hypothetical protein